jgi:hypothetical protein
MGNLHEPEFPTTRIAHPAHKLSIHIQQTRRGLAEPRALGKGQAFVGSPRPLQPIIMPAYGGCDAARVLASQQAAYCMSWACLLDLALPYMSSGVLVCPALDAVAPAAGGSGSHQILPQPKLQ